MRFIHIIYLCLLVGCDQVVTRDKPEQAEPFLTEELGGEGERKHDFGKVITSPDLKLSHRYLIKNRSDVPVKLIRSINQKPCCGDVEFEPVNLAPGEFCNLTVIMKIGESVNPLSHLAIVETDHPKIKTLEFYTFANPHPKFIVERINDSIVTVNLGETKRESFVLHSFGDEKTGLVDLGSIRVITDLNNEWVGQASEIKSSGGLLERTRRFDVICKGYGTPGPRSSPIQLKSSDEILYKGNLQWEVCPLLKVIPGVLFVTFQGKTIEKSIHLRSLDDKPFEISEITTNIPNVKFVRDKQINSKNHLIGVQLEPDKNQKIRTGVIDIKTTHPDQSEARVALFFKNPSDDHGKNKGSE